MEEKSLRRWSKKARRNRGGKEGERAGNAEAAREPGAVVGGTPTKIWTDKKYIHRTKPGLEVRRGNRN